MSNKKKILVVQKIHEAGMKLIISNPKYEFEIIDVEEMVEKIDINLFKKKDCWLWCNIDKDWKIAGRSNWMCKKT